MKRTSTLKRGNGFKKVVGNSFKKSPLVWKPEQVNKLNPGVINVYANKFKHIPLKKSSFKRTPTDIQKEVKESDSKFSKFIINRDKKCLRCGSTYLNTCSHFYPRAIWATRYEPDNCVDFCSPCHDIMESKKKEGMEYHQFMIEYLGEERFAVLTHISKMDISKADSLILARNLLKKVEDNNDIQY